MRHRVAGRKLGLPTDQRMALLRGLVRNLIMHEAIETTEPRAKEARVIAEKLITLAKQNSVHARRQARKVLPPPRPPKGMLSASGKEQKKMRADMVARGPGEAGSSTSSRPSSRTSRAGYTRMTKIGFRRGDAARMVKLEFAID